MEARSAADDFAFVKLFGERFAMDWLFE